jgi:sedoheptulokinase
LTTSLLIDFGTTSIKSALLDEERGVFSHVRSHGSAPNCATALGHYEVAPAALHERLLSICAAYSELDVPFAGIFVCSEQNGFVALDGRHQPLCNYVSWRDERSLEPLAGASTFALIAEALGERFRSITGWRPGPGLPIFSAAHLARQGLLPSTCRLATLPEWLAQCCQDSQHTVHDTMLHGLCFYDPRERRTSDDIVAAVEDLAGVHFTFGALAETGAVAGAWRHDGKRIPIYVGIGDHQCAVLGAGNLPRETLSVNIGTGSQVGLIGAETPPEFAELRPFFGADLLAAITRIPGGRALSGFIGFLEDVCVAAGCHRPDFWRMLHELTEADLQAATLDFDLAIFGGAWGYAGGGKVSGIAEGSFTLRNYLASLLMSLARQYTDVLRLFDAQRAVPRCLLSGGVARRLPLLATVLTRISGYETWPACDLDESLLGLRAVALLTRDRALDFVRAGAVFGRDCSVQGNRWIEEG